MISHEQVRLGYFPQTFPHELWCNVEARFARRRNVKSYQEFCDLLYDRRQQRSLLSLPIELMSLEARLPWGLNLNTHRIMMNHTIFPYLMRKMGDDVTELYVLSKFENFIMNLNFSTYFVRYLRICRSCAEEQRRVFGEAYFDRRAQIRTLDKCLIHDEVLISSTIPTNKTRMIPISAEQVIANNMIEKLLGPPDAGNAEVALLWFLIIKRQELFDVSR